MGSPGSSVVNTLPAKQEIQVQSLGRKDTLEKAMGIHPSILAWKIPWTEEPGGLQPFRHHVIGLTDAFLNIPIHPRGLPRWLNGKESICWCKRRRFSPWVGKIPWRRKWQPTSVLLLGKSHGQRRLAGSSPQDCKELDTTERLTNNNNPHPCQQVLNGEYKSLPLSGAEPARYQWGLVGAETHKPAQQKNEHLSSSDVSRS